VTLTVDGRPVEGTTIPLPLAGNSEVTVRAVVG
jgi:hypothetical protein